MEKIYIVQKIDRTEYEIVEYNLFASKDEEFVKKYVNKANEVYKKLYEFYKLKRDVLINSDQWETDYKNTNHIYLIYQHKTSKYFYYFIYEELELK